MLLGHQQCPLCGQGDVLHSSFWEHLLCNCIGAAAVGTQGDLSFLQQACQQLSLPLAVYTMSHHVARFIWLLMQHVHTEHCAYLCPVKSSLDTPSISRTSGSMGDVSQLIFSEDDDSDFGFTGLHRHAAHL